MNVHACSDQIWTQAACSVQVDVTNFLLSGHGVHLQEDADALGQAALDLEMGHIHERYVFPTGQGLADDLGGKDSVQIGGHREEGTADVRRVELVAFLQGSEQFHHRHFDGGNRVLGYCSRTTNSPQHPAQRLTPSDIAPDCTFLRKFVTVPWTDRTASMIPRASYSSRPIRLSAILASALAVFAVLFCVYVSFAGALHLFDWDELIFAEAAREMRERGDFLRVYVNYVPFFEKPPGFFWLQAFCFQLLGVGETAARLPSNFFTAATGALVFVVGSYVVSPSFGLLWAALFGLGLLPAVLGKLGLIDPTFNFFVLLGIICLFAAEECGRRDRIDRSLPSLHWLPGGYLSVGAMAFGAAVLIKGPLALAIGFTTFAIYKIFVPQPTLSILRTVLFVLGTLAVAGSWFVVEGIAHGPQFIVQFVLYQLRITGTDDGHPGFAGFHLLLFLFGCFPFSVFAVRGCLTRALYRERRFQVLAIVLFAVVLVLFEVVVRTKLIHYSSLLQVPGAFLAARVLWRVWRGEMKIHWLELIGLGMVALAIAAPLIAMPYLGNNRLLLERFLRDPASRSYLDTPVRWGAETFIPGVLMIGGTFLAIALWVVGRARPAVVLLIATSALFCNTAWIIFAGRLDAYVATPMVRYIGRAGAGPLAFYGPLTYLPPFYARRAVANPDSPAQLEALLDREPDLEVVTRTSEIGQIASFNRLRVQDRYGAYLLLGPATALGRRDNRVASAP